MTMLACPGSDDYPSITAKKVVMITRQLPGSVGLDEYVASTTAAGQVSQLVGWVSVCVVSMMGNVCSGSMLCICMLLRG